MEEDQNTESVEEKEEEVSPVEKESHHNEKTSSLLGRFGKNPWMVSTILLGIVVVLYSVSVVFTGAVITGGVISEASAGDKIIEFANSQTGGGVELVEVSELAGLYQVTVKYQGQDLPLFITKDGQYLVQGVTPLETVKQQAQQQAAPKPTYSEEDLVKLKVFSECLAEKGVQAYGAGWCGYCKRLKDTFGGAAQIEPFYLECQNADRTPTEHADTCEEEEIRGFPTIKLNGESSELNALSTLEEFAETTGCPLPELSQ